MGVVPETHADRYLALAPQSPPRGLLCCLLALSEAVDITVELHSDRLDGNGIGNRVDGVRYPEERTKQQAGKVRRNSKNAPSVHTRQRNVGLAERPCNCY